MIMPAGRPLLLPANPKFIAMTLVLGLLANMLLGLLGWRGLPDVLAIVLVFWIVYQPRRVGLVLALGAAFLEAADFEAGLLAVLLVFETKAI